MSDDSHEERARRIGQNEALFREVNERLNDLNQTFATVSGAFELVCECGNDKCFEKIAMPPREYPRLRSDDLAFAIVPGHETRDVEFVVERHDGYYIVKKRGGEAARTARETERQLSDRPRGS